MRICVVGCGAVGSLFAANLATLDDVEVWAFDSEQNARRCDQKERIAIDRCGSGRRQAERDLGPGRAAPCDFGIVATKAMHADGAIAATAHAFADGAVASVMNGVGNEETLAAHVERVIRGTTFPAGKLLEPGVVQWDVKGDTTLGPFEPRPMDVAAIEPLADACTRAGMPTSAVGDARPGQWRKVIFNAATNPIGALTGLTHGRVCERPDLRALVSGLVAEGTAVATAQGIVLDADPGGAHRPRRPSRRRVRAQGLHAAGRRGAARDGDRLSERRHRTLRARARRADAAPRRGHRIDQGG